MDHQRQPGGVGDLERDVERHGAGIPRCMHADAHLDAADRVAIGARDLHRVDRRHQPEIAALADHHAFREAVDAGEGDVDERDDAHRRRLDHMFEEAGIVAGPGASRVDERRAAAAREPQGIDAERRAAPIDMGVEIDEAGRDDIARDVAQLCAVQPIADRRDPAVGEADVGDAIDPLRGVDDAAALEDEIVFHRPTPALPARLATLSFGGGASSTT